MNNNPGNNRTNTNAQSKGGANFRPIAICCYGNAVIMTFLTFYFFLIPFCMMVYYLIDPGLKGRGIPRLAVDLHRSLSPDYEKWARQRVSSGQAMELSVQDIAETEWPVFGSAFYLWATQSLQVAWEENNNISALAPNVYAADAIEAATELITDPGHASWVKQHWGQDYLFHQNVFYRMLLISAMTNYHELLGGDKHFVALQEQVRTLSEELDRSPYGLLDDYPGQCYPSDIVAAIAAIKQSDRLLEADYTDFVKRSIRAFSGELVDATGLPPYIADSKTGAIGIARGCTSQWTTVWAPQLWPEHAKQLYGNFEKHFWQRRWIGVGFREFPKDIFGREWYIDVDSGPVIAGFGTVASAFGIGSARANGRFDHAYPLSAEAIVFAWPLPNGVLAIPRILSNMTHAPYIGETAVLFALTRTPPEGLQISSSGRLPLVVYLALGLYLGIGIILILTTLVVFKRRRRRMAHSLPAEKIQLTVWAGLILAGFVAGITHYLLTGSLLILCAQFLPQYGRKMVKSQK